MENAISHQLNGPAIHPRSGFY